MLNKQQCLCDDGYTGEYCELNANDSDEKWCETSITFVSAKDCSNNNLCSQAGQCSISARNVDLYCILCKCKPGHKGKYCEIDDTEIGFPEGTTHVGYPSIPNLSGSTYLLGSSSSNPAHLPRCLALTGGRCSVRLLTSEPILFNISDLESSQIMIKMKLPAKIFVSERDTIKIVMYFVDFMKPRCLLGSECSMYNCATNLDPWISCPYPEYCFHVFNNGICESACNFSACYLDGDDCNSFTKINKLFVNLSELTAQRFTEIKSAMLIATVQSFYLMETTAIIVKLALLENFELVGEISVTFRALVNIEIETTSIILWKIATLSGLIVVLDEIPTVISENNTSYDSNTSLSLRFYLFKLRFYDSSKTLGEFEKITFIYLKLLGSLMKDPGYLFYDVIDIAFIAMSQETNMTTTKISIIALFCILVILITVWKYKNIKVVRKSLLENIKNRKNVAKTRKKNTSGRDSNKVPNINDNPNLSNSQPTLEKTDADENISEDTQNLEQKQDRFGFTYLMRSIIYMHDPSFMKLLNQPFVDLETTDYLDGRNALHWAASTGYLLACHEIIKKIPTMVYSLDNASQTPLFYAVDNNRYDITVYLLISKSEIGFENKFGVTAIQVAVENNNQQMFNLLISFQNSIQNSQNISDLARSWLNALGLKNEKIFDEILGKKPATPPFVNSNNLIYAMQPHDIYWNYQNAPVKLVDINQNLVYRKINTSFPNKLS
ncbi:hypothetical protein RF11_04319 [Thelohanellus kitauei]|uniref:EGF-like domain-containing protein n=1 Tax=Thelohanellus kitauei TaxID=669202 RepID=A0A0C2N3F9_THEKT|nr:hypothetical protein RF11_04319 [Thelohanellus kitauei]